MPNRDISDPVSLIINDCHEDEDKANRIYHRLAEKRQHEFTLDNGKTIHLTDQPLGEFAERFSSEVEPTFWISKRLKQ